MRRGYQPHARQSEVVDGCVVANLGVQSAEETYERPNDEVRGGRFQLRHEHASSQRQPQGGVADEAAHHRRRHQMDARAYERGAVVVAIVVQRLPNGRNKQSCLVLTVAGVDSLELVDEQLAMSIRAPVSRSSSYFARSATWRKSST